MAVNVDITLASAQSRGRAGGTMNVADSTQLDTDVIVASAASQQSDFSVPVGADGLFWVVTALNGNVRIKFDTNPTAVAAEGGGWLVIAGTTREWGAITGHKAAVILAEI